MSNSRLLEGGAGLKPDIAAVAEEHGFAQYVRTLGRGPGRSRALTREEARAALGMVLGGEADPHQVGAFLMLLRYRGEDPAEMAGLVEAARAAMGAGLPDGCAPVALDWPSYGAGRTRGAPWFLLAALTLARAGHRVLMHGSNEFTRGTPVTAGLAALGVPVCADRAAAVRALDGVGFAYLPLAVLCPGLDGLLRLRSLLGLRSPINTAARLLDPFDAGCGVDGVFHPPYIALHLETAALLGRRRLLVVKGGGARRSGTRARRWWRIRMIARRDGASLPCRWLRRARRGRRTWWRRLWWKRGGAAGGWGRRWRWRRLPWGCWRWGGRGMRRRRMRWRRRLGRVGSAEFAKGRERRLGNPGRRRSFGAVKPKPGALDG